MSSVSLVIRKRLNKNGAYPIGIRITKDRKSSYVFTGQTIEPEYWDEDKQRVKKSHPNSKRLNNLLLKELSDTNNRILEIETVKNNVSAKGVRHSLKPVGGSSFISQAKVYIDNLKAKGKYNQHSADQPRINRFKEFLKGDDISFEDITIPLLIRYGAYLKRTRDINERTLINHLVVIRTIFSRALQANIVEQKYYPFGKGKIKIKFPQSNKVGLSVEDVMKLEKLKFADGSPQKHALNVWLFSFYFAGMRISDVLRLRWSDLQDERLHYTMGKNAKAGSLKISEKAMRILDTYKSEKQNNDDLIFPELKMLKDLNNAFAVQKKISNAVSKFNKALKKVSDDAKIGKKITMHISRHTFGNISGDKIPIQMLQKLYRHSSITTTIGYQANFIHKDADEALNAVIDF